MDRKRKREKKLFENKQKSREVNQWILAEEANTMGYSSEYPDDCD